MEHVRQDVLSRMAAQQPNWHDLQSLEDVRRELRERPALVAKDDILGLRRELASVAAGGALIIQAGDCAESLLDHDASSTSRKVGLLDQLASQLERVAHRRMLRVGRIAGQFAKPRSTLVEQVDGADLPSYRGDMVNGAAPTSSSRMPDPTRLVRAYESAAAMIAHLGWSGPSEQRSGSIVWTSHEALILDYEVPLVRRDDHGQRFLGSTHWPWIGDRMRQIDGAHVALLAAVTNPVACKVGPGTSIEELIGLCERLDPDREPGRLTLISRLGAGQVERLLPSMVKRIRAEGHPVIWLCDPMHGNTLVAPCGRKTRSVDTMMLEIATFCDVVSSCGGIAGGLHLETTPDDVTECVWDERGVDGVGTRYTSLCDPRLNPSQALALVAGWMRPRDEASLHASFSGDYRHDVATADRLLSAADVARSAAQ
jgi:3-deoxy-7-phosphoheptulonate synthase